MLVHTPKNVSYETGGATKSCSKYIGEIVNTIRHSPEKYWAEWNEVKRTESQLLGRVDQKETDTLNENSISVHTIQTH